MRFQKLFSLIQNLAFRSVELDSEQVKANMSDIRACDALKSSLPTYSRNLTAETQINLCRDLGVAATFLQLAMSLYPHFDAIDKDIQTHGVAHNYNGDLSLYKKATKTMSFPKLINLVQDLAFRSARGFTSQQEKRNRFNTTACDALKRSLPIYSRNLTAETQVQLCRDLGVATTFHQLTAILYLHIDVIDNDIQTHGVACNYNKDLPLYKKPFKKTKKQK